MNNDEFSYQILRSNTCDNVYNVEYMQFNYFSSYFQVCNWCGKNHDGAICPYYSYSPLSPHYNPSWSSCSDHTWSYQQEPKSNLVGVFENFIQTTKKIEERYLDDKSKQFIRAKTEGNKKYKESLWQHEETFRKINSKLDQIEEKSTFMLPKTSNLCTHKLLK